MNTSQFALLHDDDIQAAPDTQLSSPQSNLLITLLKEEDQHDYNQLLKTHLSNDIQHILYHTIFNTFSSTFF
jgi:hypothetical protein